MISLPYIIGEAGSCHEGSLALALDLVDMAGWAGCDAVKFQFWSSPARMQARRRRPPPAYEQGSVDLRWLPALRHWAKQWAIAFGSTVYVPEDLPIILPHVDYLKIASFEARDRELVGLAAEAGKPLYISTGMMTADELQTLPARAVLLHCVSAYPCPAAQANLGAIPTCSGYSDHTGRIETGGLAVAAGAAVLEVHFRLARTPPSCPDFPHSLSGLRLREYVDFARLARTMRGSGRKEPQPAEWASMDARVVS